MGKQESAATAAGVPLNFGKVSYVMAPLTDKDIAELDEWVQHKFISMARKSLPDDATKEERDETIRIAMSSALGLTWISGQGARLMATVDGMAQLVWQGIKVNHPETTVLELRKLMFSSENLEAARVAFSKVNPQEADDPSEKKLKLAKQKRRSVEKAVKREKKRRRHAAKFTGH